MSARGQTLALGALTMLLVALMVFLTIAISVRIHEKQELQTATDAAAYSQAVATARAFNAVSAENRVLVAQLSSVAAAQALLSWVGYYHGTLNQARDALAEIAAQSACGGPFFRDAQDRIEAEDRRLIDIFEKPGCGYAGVLGHDNISADYIRSDLYVTALDIADNQRQLYGDLIAQLPDIAEKVALQAAASDPFAASGEEYRVHAGNLVTRTERDEAVKEKQTDPIDMVRATMATRGQDPFVSSRAANHRTGGFSGADFIAERLTVIIGNTPLLVRVTDFGTAYFGDDGPQRAAGPGELEGYDGQLLAGGRWLKWKRPHTEENLLVWGAWAQDSGRFWFEWPNPPPGCNVGVATEDSFGYLLTTGPNDDRDNHMWRRGNRGFGDYREWNDELGHVHAGCWPAPRGAAARPLGAEVPLRLQRDGRAARPHHRAARSRGARPRRRSVVGARLLPPQAPLPGAAELPEPVLARDAHRVGRRRVVPHPRRRRKANAARLRRAPCREHARSARRPRLRGGAMSAARATSRRGQATTELALLSIVFVTVLVFGVHFAELGALKLRVQQAGIFATWSATGDRAHKLNRPDPLQSPLFYDANDLKDGRNRSPAQATLERYADFDGASGAAGTQVTWSVTRGTSLSARCQPAAVAVPPVLTTPLQRLAPGYRYAQDGNREVDAVACNAHGHIALFGVPAEVLEGQDGFFKRKNIWRPSVEVCAFGRARSGSCRPGPPVAIDDWGLAGDEGGESLQCGFACTIEQAPDSNIAYKQTVQRLYEEYAKSRSLTRNWAIASFVKELFTRNPDDPTLMWFVPVDERDFRFAFTGEDAASQPFHIVTSEIDGTSAGYGPNARVEHRWATTPYSSKYRAGYDDRGQCFAGLPCARSPFDKQHW